VRLPELRGQAELADGAGEAGRRRRQRARVDLQRVAIAS